MVVNEGFELEGGLFRRYQVNRNQGSVEMKCGEGMQEAVAYGLADGALAVLTRLFLIFVPRAREGSSRHQDDCDQAHNEGQPAH